VGVGASRLEGGSLQLSRPLLSGARSFALPPLWGRIRPAARAFLLFLLCSLSLCPRVGANSARCAGFLVLSLVLSFALPPSGGEFGPLRGLSWSFSCALFRFAPVWGRNRLAARAFVLFLSCSLSLCPPVGAESARCGGFLALSLVLSFALPPCGGGIGPLRGLSCSFSRALFRFAPLWGRNRLCAGFLAAVPAVIGITVSRGGLCPPAPPRPQEGRVQKARGPLMKKKPRPSRPSAVLRGGAAPRTIGTTVLGEGSASCSRPDLAEMAGGGRHGQSQPTS